MPIKPLVDAPVVGRMPTNITEAVRIACKQPTLIDALTYIAIWDSERFVLQAKEHFETGKRFSDGTGWETCFRRCFEAVFKAWAEKEEQKYEDGSACRGHPVPGKEHVWVEGRAPGQYGKMFCTFCGAAQEEE